MMVMMINNDNNGCESVADFCHEFNESVGIELCINRRYLRCVMLERLEHCFCSLAEIIELQYIDHTHIVNFVASFAVDLTVDAAVNATCPRLRHTIRLRFPSKYSLQNRCDRCTIGITSPLKALRGRTQRCCRGAVTRSRRRRVP